MRTVPAVHTVVPICVAHEEVNMEKLREYAFSAILDTSYEDAVSRITDALKEEGFRVLTWIFWKISKF